MIMPLDATWQSANMWLVNQHYQEIILCTESVI